MPPLTPPPATSLDGAALFLDFDGTLVELAETPDAISVPPRLGSLLARLRDRLDGRLAIVSGRALADLERYVPASNIAFSGSHGLEMQLADGTCLPLQIPPQMDAVRERVNRFVGGRNGLSVEEKPAGIAIHYRQAPGEARRVGDFMEMLAREAKLIVQRGKMVVELRPPGADKGDAVRALMKECPFAGARPIFVGDDLTDEHAFAAAAGLGGFGVLVGDPRDTRAAHRLPSVPAVASWLEGAA